MATPRAFAAAAIVTAAMLVAVPAVACKDDDFDRVIRDEGQQERFDWKFAQAFNNRCAAYLTKGDFDRAMQDCNQAVRYDPKSAIAFSNRGVAYAGKGDLDRAIQDYDEAIRLDPYLTAARHNRADAFEQQNEYERALLDYDEIVGRARWTPGPGTIAAGRVPSLGNWRQRLRIATSRCGLAGQREYARQPRIHASEARRSRRFGRGLRRRPANQPAARHRAVRTRRCEARERRPRGRRRRHRGRRSDQA